MTKRNRAVQRFTWKEWWWTHAEESLFALDKNSLNTFRLLIKEAEK